MVQKKTEAINCYMCDPGTDGCGASFKKTGGGVLATSNSNGMNCTVSILLMFL